MGHNSKYAIGVDIGGTKTAFVLMSEFGRVKYKKRILTKRIHSPEDVLINLSYEIANIIDISKNRVVGIGIATPGYLDDELGIVRSAVNLGWKDVPVVQTIQENISIDIPVFLKRDTQAETLGEYFYGAGKNCTDFAYLGIGTGLGAGVISGGSIISGKNNLALEIGHLSFDPEGLKCACGNRGCLETVLSGNGLLRSINANLEKSYQNSLLKKYKKVSAVQIIKCAQKGDPLSRLLLRQMGEAFGLVCSMIKSIFDPDRFIVGGGLGKVIFPYIVPFAQEQMPNRSFNVDGLIPDFYLSELNSSAMGAASLVWYFNKMKIKKSLDFKEVKIK